MTKVTTIIRTIECNPELQTNVFMFRFLKKKHNKTKSYSLPWRHVHDSFMLSILKLIHISVYQESIDLSLLKFMFISFVCLPSKFIWKKCLVEVQLLHDFISEH